MNIIKGELYMNIFINTNRNGYSPYQCKKTMSVGDLIDCLSQFDLESKVYLRNDNGYTYGSITYNDIEIDEDDEDGQY